jgi:hypothetical protein
MCRPSRDQSTGLKTLMSSFVKIRRVCGAPAASMSITRISLTPPRSL